MFFFIVCSSKVDNRVEGYFSLVFTLLTFGSLVSTEDWAWYRIFSFDIHFFLYLKEEDH